MPRLQTQDVAWASPIPNFLHLLTHAHSQLNLYMTHLAQNCRVFALATKNWGYKTLSPHQLRTTATTTISAQTNSRRSITQWLSHHGIVVHARTDAGHYPISALHILKEMLRYILHCCQFPSLLSIPSQSGRRENDNESPTSDGRVPSMFQVGFGTVAGTEVQIFELRYQFRTSSMSSFALEYFQTQDWRLGDVLLLSHNSRISSTFIGSGQSVLRAVFQRSAYSLNVVFCTY